MKTRIMDSPAKRIPIAVATLTGLILIVAAIYIFHGSASTQRPNGLKIIQAARTYTRALRENHLPVPQSVPLQFFIEQGLLQPADLGSFQGMDAKIFLTANNGSLPALMQVHMPDGTDMVLLADGSMRQVMR